MIGTRPRARPLKLWLITRIHCCVAVSVAIVALGFRLQNTTRRCQRQVRLRTEREIPADESSNAGEAITIGPDTPESRFPMCFVMPAYPAARRRSSLPADRTAARTAPRSRTIARILE